jgi:hypothetical protein
MVAVKSDVASIYRGRAPMISINLSTRGGHGRMTCMCMVMRMTMMLGSIGVLW